MRASEPLGVEEGPVPAGDSQARRPRVHPAGPWPRSQPAGRPLLGSGSPAAGSRARADAEGRAPAHRRPRAACQTRRKGSAMYGPRAGRKCLVGSREEAPNMARGGRGRAGGGEPARDGGRFRRRGRSRHAPPCPPSAPRLRVGSGPGCAGDLHLSPPSPHLRLGLLCAAGSGVRGPGSEIRGPAWLGRPTETSWIPSSARTCPGPWAQHFGL